MASGYASRSGSVVQSVSKLGWKIFENKINLFITKCVLKLVY